MAQAGTFDRKLNCSCNAGPFNNLDEWTVHYNTNRPAKYLHEAAIQHAHLHNPIPINPYVSQTETSKDELIELKKLAFNLDAQLAILEKERHNIQKRIDEIELANMKQTPVIRTVTVVDIIDNRPNKQGTRAGEMVIEGLRRASPEKTYEMIYLEASMNGKVKIVEKIRA